MEVKEIIDKVYETIDSLYEDGKLRPYMRVYVDKNWYLHRQQSRYLYF